VCSILVLAVACGGETSEESTGGVGEPPAPVPAATVEDAGNGDDAGEETTSGASFAAQLTAGSCFNDEFDTDGDYDTTGDPVFVDCSRLHDNEVVSQNRFDLGADAPYPTGDEWESFFDGVCEPAIVEFIGTPDLPPGLLRYVLGPEEADWVEGDRSAPCVIALDDAPLIGSAAGLGPAIRPASYPPDAPEPAGLSLSQSASIEDSYAPSGEFVDEAGLDIDGFVGTTFEAGPVADTKADLETVIASSDWEVIAEQQWRGDNETAYFALADGDDESHIIVEIWQLEGGDSRLHYFYRPDPPLEN
jgi:hypothetical protein